MDIIVTSVQEFLIKNIPKIVVKFSRDAKKNETLESRRAADVYIAARTNTDSWITYSSFNEEMIRNAAALIPTSFTDQEIKIYSMYKDRIPYEYRNYFVQAAHDWILLNYEEKNEYYRMLSGQPPIGAEDLYVEDEVYEKYGVEKMPVHMLPQMILNMMDDAGIFAELHKEYPHYDYLLFMGLRKIDILKARNADNFDILYMPKKVENYSFYRDFIRCYDQAKEYILSVVYNIYYTSKYDYYDNYLGFVILMMAVQQLFSNVFKILVNRDFYDTNTIRMFLESYGIPYSSSFTIYQNRLLVKNLNILLRKKSNTTVMLDIMDLLGFNDYELVKYYLVKHHKTDDDGNPIFKYLKDVDGNPILDENGNKILDAEEVYEFYFNGIPVDAEDVQNEIYNSNNVLSYNEMVRKDDLWVHDDTTKQMLIETEFNYLQTKYIDVNAVFRLQDIIFETVYLTRLILDKKENETKSIMVTMNQVSEIAIPLFDCFILLICLMCKQQGIEPDLLTSPSKIMYILGFNFEADFETIRQDILNNRVPRRTPDGEQITIPGLYKSDLANYIMDNRLDTVKSVNDMYVKVRDLEKLLVEGMEDAESLEAYEAYKTLYKTLMFTRLNNSIYNLKDGTTPEKFSDYLNEINYDLYTLYESVSPEQASEYIEYITQRLMVLFDDVEYLDAIQLLSISDIDALIRLLRFFQSYTVDVRSSRLILVLDSKYDNMAHTIDYVKGFFSKIKINEDYDSNDMITKIGESIKMRGIAKVEFMMKKMVASLYQMDYRDFQEVMTMIATGKRIENYKFFEKVAMVSYMMYDLTKIKSFEKIFTFYGKSVLKDIRSTKDEKDFYITQRLMEYKDIYEALKKMDIDLEMDELPRDVFDFLYKVIGELFMEDKNVGKDSVKSMKGEMKVAEGKHSLDKPSDTKSELKVREARGLKESIRFIWED